MHSPPYTPFFLFLWENKFLADEFLTQSPELVFLVLSEGVGRHRRGRVDGTIAEEGTGVLLETGIQGRVEDGRGACGKGLGSDVGHWGSWKLEGTESTNDRFWNFLFSFFFQELGDFL